MSDKTPKRIDLKFTEVTTLPSKHPDKIGFMVHEVPFDDKTPDYDAAVLSSTDEADRYRRSHENPMSGYRKPLSTGYTHIDCLPKLIGRPWDQYALNMVHALRPSCIVVTGGEVTCDAVPWRVTVTIEEDNRTIKNLTQEVHVGLTGASHGHGLNKYAAGLDPAPQRVFFNTRGLKKLSLDKPKDGT